MSTMRVCVRGELFTAVLICLPLVGLEVILGMDWLFLNRVVLDCRAKRVVFSQLLSTDESYDLYVAHMDRSCEGDDVLLLAVEVKKMRKFLLIFVLLMSIRMCFRKIFLSFHLRGKWSSVLICYPVLDLSL